MAEPPLIDLAWENVHPIAQQPALSCGGSAFSKGVEH